MSLDRGYMLRLVSLSYLQVKHCAILIMAAVWLYNDNDIMQNVPQEHYGNRLVRNMKRMQRNVTHSHRLFRLDRNKTNSNCENLMCSNGEYFIIHIYKREETNTSFAVQ
jgi:hypothetical protein